MKNIIILGGARDYHIMDWYRTIKKIEPKRNIRLLTDLIGGENFDIIVKEDDEIDKLLIIDNFLFSKQSALGNLWRNIFKLMVLPVQVFKLKKYSKKYPNNIYHAQPMYYMFLCWLAKIEFIGTPQGSEILVRPNRSKIYKLFAKHTLQAAKYITVDSASMRDEIYKLSANKAIIIQNGIDIQNILRYTYKEQIRDKVTSIRGMTDLYRIDEIVSARNDSKVQELLNFIYPFGEETYSNNVKIKFRLDDNDLGRLEKERMYQLLSKTKLVISIPKSDSSPRSVYESIFLGSCVAITYNSYFDVLPNCMKERIYIVDLENKNWYDEAISFANEVSNIDYIPSQEAIDMFDQNVSMKNAIKILY